VNQAAPLQFLSAEWVAACVEAINASETYRVKSTDWTYGPVSLVASAQPALGLERAQGVWIDLDRGICRAARLVSSEEAEGAPFTLTSDYSSWRQVLRKQLSLIAGLLERRIALKGSLPVMLRYVKSAEELVSAVATVPTRFVDE
jgi:putative sterol carrier protein